MGVSKKTNSCTQEEIWVIDSNCFSGHRKEFVFCHCELLLLSTIYQDRKISKLHTNKLSEHFIYLSIETVSHVVAGTVFSCNLRPACANESRSPASVQPLSAVVWGLEHSWSIPLCFHGSVWSLSAGAEWSLLTGAWTDRVNAEFTRLSPCLALLSSLCLF